MTQTRLVISLLTLLVSSSLNAGNDDKFEGTISATLTRPGTGPTHFVFTRKGDLLRIENATDKLEPINIVDLTANKVTIIYPHNTTFVTIDSAKVPTETENGSAPRTADPDRMQQSARPDRPLPGSTIPATTPGKVGPDITPPPGFPSLPATPQTSQNSTGGVRMGMPMMPPIPDMSGPVDLKKADKTKKTGGFDCALYTASERRENLEIWATNDSSLFPFHLLERDYLSRRRFGPQILEEKWPELSRQKSVFPLEATLKLEGTNQERFNFKVEKIDRHKIDNEALFKPPENYHQMEAPTGF